MPADLRDRVLAYIADHHVMTLACAGPWAASVFYASDGFTLYFLSSPRSRHSQAFAQDARAAVTIQENCADWREVKGVQLEARVSVLAGEERERAQAIYAKKFPLIAGDRAPEEIRRALAKIEWYKVAPGAVCFIDNSVAFGHRDRFEL